MNLATVSLDDLLRDVDALREKILRLDAGAVAPSASIFTVGPGFVIHRGERSIDVTPKDRTILEQLVTGSCAITDVMHRGSGAAWREQYRPEKRAKIGVQLRRLNDRLLKLSMSVSLEGDDLIVRIYNVPFISEI